MANKISTLSILAEARFKAVSLKQGAYVVLNAQLHWVLTSTTDASRQYESSAAAPQFAVPPDVYTLQVTHGDKTAEINRIELAAGDRLHELAFLDVTGEPDPNEKFYLDNGEFNPETEYERRQVEREGQREFGLAEKALQAPNKQNAFGEGALMSHQNMLQAHPMLANAAQFSGVDPSMSTPDQNPHAEENANNPELVPGAKPQLAAAPASAPGMSPRPTR